MFKGTIRRNCSHPYNRTITALRAKQGKNIFTLFYFSSLATMLSSVQAAQLDVRDAFKEAQKSGLMLP